MSTIYTIQKNLQNTIAGKEAYLASLKNPDDMFNMEARMVVIATREFLEININELKVILNDVNTACSEFSLMTWEINPERMGQ